MILIHPTLKIQLSDLPTYVKTLHQMHIHYPSLVLVPDTFLSPHVSSDAKASLLIESIEGEFGDVPIEPVKRKYWNETIGSSHTPSRDEHHRLSSSFRTPVYHPARFGR
jgi:hypothetical protein